MWKKRITALIVLTVAFAAGLFVWNSEKNPDGRHFKLGLDLAGGTHLLYSADVSNVPRADIGASMEALRDVIERRVNLFGVSEPLIQVEEGGTVGSAREYRLIVELPGVTDIAKAIELIGKTPLLEFRLMKDLDGLSEEEIQKLPVSEAFTPTELSGRHLKGSELGFDQNTRQPIIELSFNAEGEKLFADITRENVGKVLAIFLDSVPISLPVIQEEILGGKAQISGKFTATEARELARNLRYGALPVPISLVSTQTVGATLGAEDRVAAVRAGIAAFILIAVFLMIWYRLPGAVATVALLVYVALNLLLFKLIPVTLTAAGIAGFVLSLGMAVDANILIFERMKEELRRGKMLQDAMQEGFARAWTSIRDSNLSSIITAIILYYLAATPVIKGFALVFGIGVITSMFSAITASRTFLFAVRFADSRATQFLFGSGFMKAKD